MNNHRVLTLFEVADYLHISPSTMYRLLNRGKVPGFKLGSDWRFNLEDIDRWRCHLESDAGWKR